MPARKVPLREAMMAFLWVRDILIGVFSVFFLFWGITLLLSAYSLKNPLEFIMMFFASNFIVLVSASGMLFSSLRLWRLCKEKCRPS